jgi:broad specificity phosphatase PhoE
MATGIQNIVLVRHDVSIANVDPSVYKRMPDHVIPLAELDSARVQRAAALVGALGLDPDATCSWCSPYVRCRQTEDAVLRHVFADAAARIHRRESFLLREQEFGDWDSLTDEEAEAELPRAFAKRKLLKDNLGHFYYRYPNGESRADVVLRVIALMGKVHRSDFANHLLFLHGVTQRAFRMAWLNLGVDWFEEEPNPTNASVMHIRRDAGRGWVEHYLPDGPERCSEWQRSRTVV